MNGSEGEVEGKRREKMKTGSSQIGGTGRRLSQLRSSKDK